MPRRKKSTLSTFSTAQKNAHTIESPIKQTDYVWIKQSRETNKFFEVTDKNVEIDYITGIAKMKNKRGDTGVNIKLGELPVFKLDAGTHQFFEYLLYELSKAPAKAKEICVPFNNYMKARGLKDKKSALEAACKHMAVLRAASITQESEESYEFVNIAQAGKVDSKVIRFRPADDLLKTLKRLKPLPVIWGIFQINVHKNPYSVCLLNKLLVLRRENGNRIVSVKALIDGLNDLPTKEEVALGSRHVTRSIIEPFERDLDALSWCLTWNYCGEKESEVSDDVATNYDTFIKAYINIKWLAPYPDDTKYLNAKAKHARAASKKKDTTKKTTDLS